MKRMVNFVSTCNRQNPSWNAPSSSLLAVYDFFIPTLRSAFLFFSRTFKIGAKRYCEGDYTDRDMGVQDFNRLGLSTLCSNSRPSYVIPVVVRPPLWKSRTCASTPPPIRTRNPSRHLRQSIFRKQSAISLRHRGDRELTGNSRLANRAFTVRSGVRINEKDVTDDGDGIRINKCFKSFASRRMSDDYVNNGCVTINDRVARPGDRVRVGDVVRLNGKIIDWERLALSFETEKFIYLKHWKAVGVVCTTNENDPDNIINQVDVPAVCRQAQRDIKLEGEMDRVFPVGRLDQMSSGIILLTSDGRVPNSVLGAKSQSEKKYVVLSDMRLRDSDIEQLREGITISTTASRDRRVRKPIVSPTLRCDVERGDGSELIITLKEGRNRQIRKMLGALGYTARAIHRTSFLGITLDGLAGPGESSLLNEDEMEILKNKLDEANGADPRGANVGIQ